MARKTRVLIRAFTLRRDLETFSVLAKMFERRGCEVVLASIREYSRYLKYWKPDIVIINAPGKAREVKRLASSAFVVQLGAEGGEPLESSEAQYYSTEREMYDATDLILVWGQAGRNHFKTVMPDADLSKVVVTGSPRLDAVKYLQAHPPKTKKKSIGLVARYNMLNDANGQSVFEKLALMDEIDLKKIQNECSNFHTAVALIRSILDNTDYDVSIRPYPIEAEETYHEKILPILGDRVSIDTSVSFAAWSQKQSAIITSTSTSFLEVYLLGVPMISTEAISDQADYAKDTWKIASMSQQAGSLPRSIDEACEMIKAGLQVKTEIEDIDAVLRDFHEWEHGGSALVRACEETLKAAPKVSASQGTPLPRWVFRLWDDISFKRIMKKDRYHANVNYKEGYHTLPSHIDDMTEYLEKLKPSNN